MVCKNHFAENVIDTHECKYVSMTINTLIIYLILVKMSFWLLAMQYNYIHKLTLAKGTLLHNYNVELLLCNITIFISWYYM